MSSYTARTLLAALAAGLLLAPNAEAKETATQQTYSALYHAVKHKYGARAPGRNIRKYGIKYDVYADGERGPWETRKAKFTELRDSIRQLRTLLRPARRLLVRRAVPPPQSPAGVMSSTQGAPPGGVLDRIAQCESRGNPQAVNPNGHYGKYQFDIGTWNSVGGTGNPANASEAEQDMRAARLYAQRGSAPWACKP